MADRPLVVTAHAIDRLRERTCDTRYSVELRQEIRDQVAQAFAAGRIANHKQRGFGLWNEKRRQLPEGQRFVWTKDGRCGWIIARERDVDVVITSLTRTEAA